jgi:hypothetical protein
VGGKNKIKKSREKRKGRGRRDIGRRGHGGAEVRFTSRGTTSRETIPIFPQRNDVTPRCVSCAYSESSRTNAADHLSVYF